MADKKRQTKGILKLAGSALGGQALFTLIGVLGIVNNKSFVWPWWPAIAGMLFAFICALSIVISGMFLRRAYFLYVSTSFIPFCWVIPLLASGFELAPSGLLQAGIILLFCGLNCLLYYKITTRKLVDINKVQMLNVNQGSWNLSKSLVSTHEKARNESLAKALIPLGPIIGTILYRNFSDISTIGAALSFLLACLVITVTGVNVAVAVFLKQSEKRLGKNIIV